MSLMNASVFCNNSLILCSRRSYHRFDFGLEESPFPTDLLRLYSAVTDHIVDTLMADSQDICCLLDVKNSISTICCDRLRATRKCLRCVLEHHCVFSSVDFFPAFHTYICIDSSDSNGIFTPLGDYLDLFVRNMSTTHRASGHLKRFHSFTSRSFIKWN